jgi:hypothetical protein
VLTGLIAVLVFQLYPTSVKEEKYPLKRVHGFVGESRSKIFSKLAGLLLDEKGYAIIQIL